MSHPRQVVNGFTRRKPRHVRQTRSFSLAAFGMLFLSHIAGAQPLGINPSAAPSDIGNLLNKSCRPRLGRLESERHQPSCGGVADFAAERDPWRRSTPGARPAPDHPAVACPHPRRDAAERDHGKRRHLAGAPGSLGDVLDRPGRYRRILRRAAVHDQRGGRASRPTHDYGNERCPEGFVVEVPGDCARGPAEVLACAPNTRIRGHLA